MTRGLGESLTWVSPLYLFLCLFRMATPSLVTALLPYPNVVIIHLPPSYPSTRLSAKYGILLLILYLCILESVWIRTSSAINPQSRSDRVRGSGFPIPRVPGYILNCVLCFDAKAGFHVYPALF